MLHTFYSQHSIYNLYSIQKENIFKIILLRYSTTILHTFKYLSVKIQSYSVSSVMVQRVARMYFRRAVRTSAHTTITTTHTRPRTIHVITRTHTRARKHHTHRYTRSHTSPSYCTNNVQYVIFINRYITDYYTQRSIFIV